MVDQPYRASKNSFHLARFVLAAMVIFCHSFTLAQRTTPLSGLTGGIMNEGTLAVDGFLAISGFLVYQSALRSRNCVTFLLKRVARLLPALLAALVFSALVVGAMAYPGPMAEYVHLEQDGPLSWILNWLTLNVQPEQWGVTGVFASNPTSSLNVSLWTLKFEAFLYLLTALLMLTRLLRRRAALTVLLIASLTLRLLLTAYGVRVWDVEDPRFWVLSHWNYDRLTQTATFFFAGAALYAYQREIPRRWYLAVIAGLALTLVGCFGGVTAVADAASGASRLLWQSVEALLRLAYTLALPYLIVYLGSSPLCSGFARAGDLSLGLYLYSYPLQQLILHIAPATPPLLLFLLTMLLTLPLATISWRCIEAPVLRLKNRPSS